MMGGRLSRRELVYAVALALLLLALIAVCLRLDGSAVMSLYQLP